MPHLGDHAQVLASLKARFAGQAKAIIFNLGYLPGSDKSIQTQPQSTRHALDAAQQLLHPRGILLVTAYRGHTGGQEEADCVAQWMEQAIRCGSQAKCHSPQNTRAIPPHNCGATVDGRKALCKISALLNIMYDLPNIPY